MCGSFPNTDIIWSGYINLKTATCVTIRGIQYSEKYYGAANMSNLMESTLVDYFRGSRGHWKPLHTSYMLNDFSSTFSSSRPNLYVDARAKSIYLITVLFQIFFYGYKSNNNNNNNKGLQYDPYSLQWKDMEDRKSSPINLDIFHLILIYCYEVNSIQKWK